MFCFSCEIDVQAKVVGGFIVAPNRENRRSGRAGVVSDARR
jgi:hypothetical protein